MLELFFDNGAGWFAFPAFVGTFIFALRLVLTLAGGAGGADLDLDMDVDAAGHTHGDPGDAFKVLSVQVIAAFLMGFGWAGLGAYRGSELSWQWSLAIGAVGGVAMVWLLMILLRFIHSLQASGNINVRNALDAEGGVYVSIPGDGKRGQVRVIIDGRQRIFNAISEDNAPIDSKQRIKVTKVNNDNTLTVRTL